MILNINIPTLYAKDIRLVVTKEGGKWRLVKDTEYGEAIFGVMLANGQIWDAVLGWSDWPHKLEDKSDRRANQKFIKKLERKAQ